MLKTEGYENSELFMALTPKNGVKASKLYSYKPINSNGDFVWSRALTAYRKNQEGLLELMGSNVPRIDYTNTCPELLMEKASANILLRSQEFDNASWSKASNGTGSNPIVTANDAIAPDGTLTADKIVFNTGIGITASDESLIFQTPSASAGVYAGSVWLKGAVGGEKILFRHVGSSAYDLLTLTTQWVRYDKIETYSANLFSISVRQDIFGTINANPTIYAWGAQLETGEYATSYIPTTTTSVTRPKDVAYNTANGFLDSAWSIVMRVRLNNVGTSTDEPLISLNDGTSDVYFSIYTDANPKLHFQWDNSLDIDVFDTTDLTNGIYNIGVSYDDATADYIIVINGVQEFAGTLVVNPPGVFSGFTRMDLGSVFGIGNMDGDGIIGVQYYNSALSQTDLINLTTA